MKNVLQFYYNLEINSITRVNNEYVFSKDNLDYLFSPIYISEEEINELYFLTLSLIQIGLPCHNIILNNKNEIITPYNNQNYILLKKNITSNEPITINDIINFSNYTSLDWNLEKLNRTNWKELWIIKIDYFEYQLSQIGNKYPLLCKMFGYYEGIVENGIQLFDMYSIKGNVCVSHKRLDINTSLSEFYNPLNFIIDYKIRDIAEYFKKKVISYVDIDSEIIYFLDNYIVNDTDRILFMIRFFFPSFYFDVYEKVMIETSNKKKLDNILVNSNKYEMLLKKIYAYVSTYINIPSIDWLKY